MGDPFTRVPAAKQTSKKPNSRDIPASKTKSPEQTTPLEPAFEKPVKSDSIQDSYASHFFDGIEDQLKSKLKKDLKIMGRAVAKDAVAIVSEIVVSFFKGGKTRSSRKH
jgi:hypothetical protein